MFLLGAKIERLLLAGLSRIGDRGKMGNGKVKMGVEAAVCTVMLWRCFAAPAAFAGPYEDGVAACYDRPDYATAFRLMRPLAGQGDAAAQGYLGFLYKYGLKGMPQDYVQAHLWCNLSVFHTSFKSSREAAAMAHDIVAAKMTPAGTDCRGAAFGARVEAEMMLKPRSESC